VAGLTDHSVTILNWMWISDLTWEVSYAQIEDTKRLEELFTVRDRDGNVVHPTIVHTLGGCIEVAR
jgi:hypothetical protein